MAEIERARPLLGTRVAIRVAGLGEAAAHRAVERAFEEVEAVHAAMSFHASGSELSRLNREAWRAAVRVGPRTHRVLRFALHVAAASAGRFDPSVAPRLVALGVLPEPHDAPPPDPGADWRDVILATAGAVRFRKPLWLDLGGIAKGYAVDRAVASLRKAGARAGAVDAGGDLRLFGPGEHTVLLRDGAAADAVPLLRLGACAVASSAVPEPDGAAGPLRCGLPLDGRGGKPIRAGLGVAVVAPWAWLADALTKVVLADVDRSAGVLRAFGAAAFVRDGREWARLPP